MISKKLFVFGCLIKILLLLKLLYSSHPSLQILNRKWLSNYPMKEKVPLKIATNSLIPA